MQYGSILCRVFAGTQGLAELNETGREGRALRYEAESSSTTGRV